MHREMEAPRSGNPSLAYGFRATPELAICLNVHHKRPSLRRHLSSPFSPFSLYSFPSVPRPPSAPAAPIGLQSSLVRHFSKLSPRYGDSHCLALSLSSRFHADCAVQLSCTLSAAGEPASRLIPASNLRTTDTISLSLSLCPTLFPTISSHSPESRLRLKGRYFLPVARPIVEQRVLPLPSRITRGICYALPHACLGRHAAVSALIIPYRTLLFRLNTLANPRRYPCHARTGSLDDDATGHSDEALISFSCPSNLVSSGLPMEFALFRLIACLSMHSAHAIVSTLIIPHRILHQHSFS
ncbi:hypothetical protein K469DRAFT_396983 [Zopfia rhizophila CBS 207.26]|uniref:Uncharacterized protein n=1 Tax=Zopfia rhizophila CBS 207.26 TaxID=1314779 RepID=A0A6A6DEY1_9PEZI|nr:hypothetical protein K469DRAFT_396983 [Zopfia rhizophila CBS 207.26]